MNNHINILIVEDDDQIRQTYLDGIKIFNEDKDFIIIADPYGNLQEAQEAIIKNVYDAAIIDLKLNGSNPEIGGNILAKEILNNLRFPLYVISGFTADIDNELVPSKNIFFNAHNKGEIEFDSILEQIVTIHRTGITKILNRSGEIEKYLTRIFRENLSISMPYWIEESTKQDTHDALLRYTLNHLQEFLEVNDEGYLYNYHIPEIYIKTPIKKSEKTVYTGDIVKDIKENTHYLILTPICDLAIDKKRTNPKANFLTLVRINPFDNDYNALGKEKRQSLQSNKEYVYHYLPKFESIFEGGLVDFQRIKSVSMQEILNPQLFNVEVSISNAFKKDIISRFSSYYSRQGQPVISYFN